MIVKGREILVNSYKGGKILGKNTKEVVLSDYPEKLTMNRKEIECNFIFSLWKQPDLIGEYNNTIENGRDVITEDGMFYYGIITQLFKLGYRVFDHATVYTFLANKPTLKEEIRIKRLWFRKIWLSV